MRRAADPPRANAILKIVEHGARLVPKNYEYQSILKSVLKCLRAAVVPFSEEVFADLLAFSVALYSCKDHFYVANGR